MSERIYPVHVREYGGSTVLVLPRSLREALGIFPRDVVCIRKVGRMLLLKKLVPGEVMPVSVEEAHAAAESAR
jgi:bifunctional DNA-binding transcriptional regulator/antitoxin component of YhaV-PrlF toxin-antitoxin module